MELMNDIGMDAYRFSISWSRIFPSMNYVNYVQNLSFFFCYCSLIPPCILPDGTGEPNEEGLSYYNSLIDALLDKGLVYSIVWCLHNANCFQQPLI